MTAGDTPTQIIIAGSGKLATELLTRLDLGSDCQLVPWEPTRPQAEQAIVVHAGSGRELDAIAEFCAATGSPLIELATGSALEGALPAFPVVLCPNTNILMLKVMYMLEMGGHLFRGNPITFTESHQAT